MKKIAQIKPLKKFEAVQIIGKYFGKDIPKTKALRIGKRFNSAHEIIMNSICAINGERS